MDASDPRGRFDEAPTGLIQRSTQTLLCPALYQRLYAVASDNQVLVANEGEHMMGMLGLDHQGRKRWVVASWGESYRINCRFCNDTRHRLWINYRFGQPDPVTGQLGTFFGICFNEDCLRDPENRAQLVDEIYDVHNRKDVTLFAVNVQGNVVRVERLGERRLPGPCRRLTDMSADEPAIQYLTGERRFGFETAEQFDLQYCTSSTDYPAAVGRIIAPIYHRGKQVGWQGRYVGDPPSKRTPKYYTCPSFPKKLTLYNLDRARGKPFVAIFEGITDVWRLPNYSVAMLGKTLSMEQMVLLQGAFPNNEPIIICVDGDAYDNCAMKIREMINRGTNPIICARLPDGYDPADFDTNVLLATLLGQAADAGVHIHI